MKTFKIGMVGCGQISDRYFKMAPDLDGVEFVATCARSMESAKKKAEEFGVGEYFDSYKTMMDQVRPDAIVVTTPHSVHAEVSLAALSRGIHVLNEKPMATSFEDCQAMVNAAQLSGVTLMSLPFYATPRILTAQSLFKEEYIGKIISAEAYLNLPGPPRDNWYYNKKIAKGGAVLDSLVYPLSAVVSILGGAKRVYGAANTLIPKRLVDGGKQVLSDVDDNATFVLEYESGQHATVRSIWGTSFFDFQINIFGRHGTIVVTLDRVILQRLDGTCTIPNVKPIEWRGWKGCFEVPLEDNAESILKHFVRHVRAGTEPTCSGARQLHVHEILFKGYDSARVGRAMSIETPYQPWFDLQASIFDTHSKFI